MGYLSYRIAREDLAGLLRTAEERAGGRFGVREQIGVTLPDVLTGSTSQIVDRLLAELRPGLSSIVASAAQAAEPTIRTVVQEELAPKLALALGVSTVLAAIISGFIGAWFASRGRGK